MCQANGLRLNGRGRHGRRKRQRETHRLPANRKHCSSAGTPSRARTRSLRSSTVSDGRTNRARCVPLSLRRHRRSSPGERTSVSCASGGKRMGRERTRAQRSASRRSAGPSAGRERTKTAGGPRSAWKSGVSRQSSEQEGREEGTDRSSLRHSDRCGPGRPSACSIISFTVRTRSDGATSSDLREPLDLSTAREHQRLLVSRVHQCGRCAQKGKPTPRTTRARSCASRPWAAHGRTRALRSARRSSPSR